MATKEHPYHIGLKLKQQLNVPLRMHMDFRIRRYQDPEVPSNLSITVVSETELQASVDPITASWFKGFNFYLDGTLQNSTPQASETYNFTGLTKGQQYTIEVTSVNKEDVESDPASATGTPADATAPSPPQNVTLLEEGDTFVRVGADPSPSTDVDYYNAYYDDGGGGVKHNSTNLTAGNISDYKFDGLTNDTTYNFWFTAVDDAGNESVASSTVTGTPTAAAGPDKTTYENNVTADGGVIQDSTWLDTFFADGESAGWLSKLLLGLDANMGVKTSGGNMVHLYDIASDGAYKTTNTNTDPTYQDDSGGSGAKEIDYEETEQSEMPMQHFLENATNAFKTTTVYVLESDVGFRHYVFMGGSPTIPDAFMGIRANYDQNGDDVGDSLFFVQAGDGDRLRGWIEPTSVDINARGVRALVVDGPANTFEHYTRLSSSFRQDTVGYTHQELGSETSPSYTDQRFVINGTRSLTDSNDTSFYGVFVFDGILTQSERESVMNTLETYYNTV